MFNQNIVHHLEQNKDDIVRDAVNRMLRPEQTQKQQNAIYDDTVYNIEYLTAAIQLESQLLFIDYVKWLNIVLLTRGIATDRLINALNITSESICAYVPEEHHAMIISYVDAAKDALSSFITASNAITADNQLANDYLKIVLTGNKQEAMKLIHDAIEAGTSIDDILLEVFQPVQREIGRLWQNNEISVAHEHFATATTQSIMSQLYSHIFGAVDDTRPVLLAACVSAELHEMGLRVLADFFEIEGWNSIYLGANVPTDSLIKMIEEHNPEIIALSTTMFIHIAEMQDAIRDIRTRIQNPPPILVGGYPFNVDENLWKRIGADGYAKDARSALTVANRLLVDD